jgi:hypothetical protein
LAPLRGQSWRWLGNYRVVAAILLVTMVGLYWQFSGSVNYYPIEAKVTLDGKPVVGAEVTCESDDPRYAFTQISDGDGKFAYGSKMMAGGAPAGRYRAKVVAGHGTVVGRYGAGQPTAIPAAYARYDSSGLHFLCEPKQNFLEIRLISVVAPSTTRKTPYSDRVHTDALPKQ